MSSEETEKHVLVLSRCPCWPIPESPLSYFFVYKLFSSWIWPKYCLLDLKQSINQSINQSICTHYCIQLYWCVFMESVLFIYVFFWVLVWPCQLFVRLHVWYRVSDVLDLSLVSKRFGFWPHITHVIVLTFKEIKHLSDYRTVGPSDCQTIGLSDYRSDPSHKII